MIELNVANLAGGALVERIQEEVQRAINNIIDPNTPAQKARKVKMEMVIKPDETRTFASVTCTVSSTLCPAEAISSSIHIAFNPATGEVGASEMFSGENVEQHILPDVERSIPGNVTKFAAH